jgi:dihydroflavonol-4-reductase
MVPNIGMPIVDIKDVSEFHVKALTTPASIGQRIVAADEFWMLPRVAETLKTAYPERKIATRIAPRLMLKIFSLFDPAIKGILPLLGREIDIDNSATNVIFDRGFIVNKDAILASAAFLERKAA